MKNIYFLLFTLFFAPILFLLTYTQLYSQIIEIGSLSYTGNGCPDGTARMVSSPDGQYISLLFDSFIANAGKNTEYNLEDTKICMLTVPVKVPYGYSATIKKVDYRGFLNVPKGSNAKIQIRYTYSRRQGLIYTKTFPGEFIDSFVFSNQLDARAFVWSACGESTALTIDASLKVRSNHLEETTMGSIDSADTANGLRYYLQLRTCR